MKVLILCFHMNYCYHLYRFLIFSSYFSLKKKKVYQHLGDATLARNFKARKKKKVMFPH